MRRSLFLASCALMVCLTSTAQATWGFRGGVGVEKKITKGMSAGFEARYHQFDNFQSTDRWSVGASLSKRLYRNEAKTFNVKAGLGYKYMHVYNGWETKYKDNVEGIQDNLEPEYYISNGYDFNLNNSYVDSRHRVTTSVQAAVELGRLKLSLREAYQFTHTDSAQFSKDKYRFKNGEFDRMETVSDGKSSSDKNVLRSRIVIDYDIPHWKLDPFVSYEMFNGIDDSFNVEKSRITAGVEFSFQKKHNFEVAYLWQNQHDDDEPAGSFICLDYTFEF